MKVVEVVKVLGVSLVFLLLRGKYVIRDFGCYYWSDALCFTHTQWLCCNWIKRCYEAKASRLFFAFFRLRDAVSQTQKRWKKIVSCFAAVFYWHTHSLLQRRVGIGAFLRCNVKQGVITVSIGIYIRISHKAQRYEKIWVFCWENTCRCALFICSCNICTCVVYDSRRRIV